jgi:hypothetical protein
MNTRFGIAIAIFAFSFAVVAQSQTATGGPSTSRPSPVILPSSLLQPALSDVQSATEGLNISKWKAPGDLRAAAQDNVDSIQRDLGNTLPSLIAQADAAPESLPPTFAVYRNVDALYDVLLRVSEAANFSAPSSDAAAVASSLEKLESARTELGNAILQISQRTEGQIAAMESEIRVAKTAPVVEKKEIIIDDGPIKSSAKRTKKKTTPKEPAPKPAANALPAGSSHG